MHEYILKEVDNKEVWENFVFSQKPNTFLQSWNWGESNKLVGKKVIRLAIYRKGKIIAGCQIIKETAKRGPHFIIPGGPFIDWNDKSLVDFFLFSIKRIAREEKVWFIRIRPDIVQTDELLAKMKSLGFVYAPMYLHAETTLVLDVSKDEDEILANMRKTTRYLIRKSLKSDLRIERSKDPKYSELLFNLQQETAQRHKFVVFPEELFKAELQTFGKDNQCELFICKRKRLIFCAALIIFYKDTAYYYHSGSRTEFRDIPSSYYLQWNVIKEAKKRGYSKYNFWGISANDNPKHRFYGVTVFKKGFGGQRYNWLHAHDLPISFLYYATYLFESFRRVIRRL